MAQKGTRCRSLYEDQDARISILDLLDLPQTLDRGRADFPALWRHRLARDADGFHELDRSLMADPAVWPFTIVLMSERLAF